MQRIKCTTRTTRSRLAIQFPNYSRNSVRGKREDPRNLSHRPVPRGKFTLFPKLWTHKSWSCFPFFFFSSLPFLSFFFVRRPFQLLMKFATAAVPRIYNFAKFPSVSVLFSRTRRSAALNIPKCLLFWRLASIIINWNCFVLKEYFNS